MSDRERRFDIGQRTLLLTLLWWIITEGRMDAIGAGFGLITVGAALSLSLTLIPPRHRPRAATTLPATARLSRLLHLELGARRPAGRPPRTAAAGAAEARIDRA
ncbi:hypothetical protein [Propionivibrio limicola]|uniref:hypothetical protein n=1 Tax=Propionivibrio limicola TaxID=167645 RepID=UPI00129189A7|nr:hypothetical protein [Propionivibrio limicola]